MNDFGYQGTERPSDGAGSYNAQKFLIEQVLNQANIGTLVQIMSVTNSGGLSPVGFVDVQPLVNQLAGDGSPTPHAVVFNVPYFRLQGGTDAVILDPKVGDIGIAVFADRDISSVKANKGAANPGSARRNDMADALYIGGVLNGTPVQYVRFSGSGIELVSPTKVTIKAPITQVDSAIIALNGNIVQTAGTGTGAATLIGPVTVVNDLTAEGKSVAHHTHTSSGAGSPTSQPPMKTLLIDRTNWDLTIDADGNIAVAEDPYAVAQDVATAIKLFFGELWYSRNEGVPYWGAMLGTLPPMSFVKAQLVRAALTVPRVAQARCIIASFVGRTIAGQVQVIDEAGRTTNVRF